MASPVGTVNAADPNEAVRAQICHARNCSGNAGRSTRPLRAGPRICDTTTLRPATNLRLAMRLGSVRTFTSNSDLSYRADTFARPGRTRLAAPRASRRAHAAVWCRRRSPCEVPGRARKHALDRTIASSSATSCRSRSRRAMTASFRQHCEASAFAATSSSNDRACVQFASTSAPVRHWIAATFMPAPRRTGRCRTTVRTAGRIVRPTCVSSSAITDASSSCSHSPRPGAQHPSSSLWNWRSAARVPGKPRGSGLGSAPRSRAPGIAGRTRTTGVPAFARTLAGHPTTQAGDARNVGCARSAARAVCSAAINAWR